MGHDTKRVIVLSDTSIDYDGYNWHDEFIRFLSNYTVEIMLMDFTGFETLRRIVAANPEFVLWRAWHVPKDRDRDRTLIEVLNSECQIKTYPSPEMHRPYDNKIYEYAMAERYGWRIPTTTILYSKDHAREFANDCPLPIVIKASEGACAQNVKIIHERPRLRQIIEEVFSPTGLPLHFPGTFQQGYLILQEYVPIEYDWRVVCIGGRLAFSGRLHAHQEGITRTAAEQWLDIATPPLHVTNLAERIADTLGWPWIAFDIADHNDEAYMLEFTSCFGFSAAHYFMEKTGSPNAWIIRKMMDELAKRHRLTGVADENSFFGNRPGI